MMGISRYMVVESFKNFKENQFQELSDCLDCVGVWRLNSGSRELFTRLISTFFNKNNFKIGSYGTIHTSKIYFVTIFSIFSNKRYSNTLSFLNLDSKLIMTIFECPHVKPIKPVIKMIMYEISQPLRDMDCY